LVSIVGHAIFQTAGCSGPSTIDRSYLGLSMTVAKTYKHTDPLKEDQTHGEDIGDVRGDGSYAEPTSVRRMR
jgi:hypothetical protein